MIDDINSIQRAYETSQLLHGRDRYLKQQSNIEKDQGYGATDASSKFIGGCLPLVIEAITNGLEIPEGGRETKSLTFLKALEPDYLALIALTECINSVRTSMTLNALAVIIGKAVELAVWAKVMRDQDTKLYVRLVQKATSSHRAISYRKRAIKATAAKAGYVHDKWPNEILAAMGLQLIDALLTSLPSIFEQYRVTNFSKTIPDTKVYLGLTKDGSDIILGLEDLKSWMMPTFKPMLVKPRPWVAFDTGAYLTPELSQRVPLVRTWDGDHITTVKAAIADSSMSLCLEALNAIQDTPWKINKPILHLLKWAWKTGAPIPGLPLNAHLPREPLPEDWNTLDEDKRKGWRITASEIASLNRGIDGDRVTMLQDIAVAESLQDHPRWYLPHSLDFRGRVYPVPSFNGQRADHIRGLFTFAEPIPIGDDGAYWLAIHLANCGDFLSVSKRSLIDRFTWVIDNEEIIKSVAASPKETINFWSQADKPFQFVAACIEYAGFLREGISYKSSLPVALDGSNSGLQHYSASLRSPEGAYVNMIPSDIPADLYQMVADGVVAAVTDDLCNEEVSDIAQIVLNQGINRKLVKRNAMTFSYSSGEYGFKQQHMTDLMKPLARKVLSGEIPKHPYSVLYTNKQGHISDDGGYKAAGYIANKVYGVITTLVKDATAGMHFFQDCAKALAHESKGLAWRTPIGLPVSHRYTEWDSKTVQMFLHDKSISVIDTLQPEDGEAVDTKRRITLTIRTKPSTRINKAKAKSAISPNVIHSLDASHLMLTVLKAKAQGITSFSLIHDSFGTHTSNTSEFFYIIREAFVDMYENYCPYKTIYKSTLKSLKDKSKAPQVPQKGTLDVQQIYSSLYAFA